MRAESSAVAVDPAAAALPVARLARLMRTTAFRAALRSRILVVAHSRPLGE
jgi:hypothetical protein